MASDSDWDDAADSLDHRDWHVEAYQPITLRVDIGQIGVRVTYKTGEQGSRGTNVFVDLPPGPWDQNRFVAVRRSVSRHGWFYRVFPFLFAQYSETRDDDFDDGFKVKVERSTRWTAMAHAYLTAERRNALLRLQDDLPKVVLGFGETPLRPSMAEESKGGFLSSGLPGPISRWHDHFGAPRPAELQKVVEAVRAMGACAEVLIKGH